MLSAILILILAAPPPAEYFLADVDNRPVLIDVEGRVVLEPKAAWAWGYSEGMFCFSDGQRVGFMDWTGRVVVPPTYAYAEGFREGYARVQLPVKLETDRERWGFIDRTGRMVIPARYWATFDFHEGAAFVLSNKASTFVDTKGRAIPAAPFGWAEHFSEGLAPVEKDYRWGFIDKRGRMAIPQVYARTNSFSEGLAAVTVLNDSRDALNVPIVGSGYIDARGKMVVEPKYSSTEPFSCGLGLVAEGSMWVPSSNRSGREGRVGKLSFIDRTGRTVFEVTGPDGRGTVARVEPFREDMAYVEFADGRKGFLDKTGKLSIVLGPEFLSVYSFDRGLARVTLAPATPGGSGVNGYINRSGKLVWPRPKPAAQS
jgi:hypothetical protein